MTSTSKLSETVREGFYFNLMFFFKVDDFLLQSIFCSLRAKKKEGALPFLSALVWHRGECSQIFQ